MGEHKTEIGNDSKQMNNNIGMFDLAKGILMLVVICGHSIITYFQYWMYYDSKNILLRLFALFFLFLMYGLVPMFFIICGYGVRKTSMKKCVRNQIKYFWKPYVCVIFIIAIATVIKKLLISESILEGLRHNVIPFLLGFCSWQSTFAGITIGGIGPIWFFVVYVLAGILLNAVMQEKQFWIQVIFVAMLGVIGILLKDVALPFCIQQAMICCGYMFVGWLMKKKKYLQMEIPHYLYVLIFAFVIILIANGGNVEVSQNVWNLGAADLIATYVAGAMLFSVFLKLNRFTGKISEAIRWVGRRSMWICCVHTVAYIVIPWDRIAAAFGMWKILGLGFECLSQLFFVVCGVKLIEYVQKQNRK